MIIITGGIGLIIVIGIVAVIAAFVIAQAFERRHPERLLAARLAKGEIDDAEYSRLFMLLRFGPDLVPEELEHQRPS
jgi:uncharacterized membrane protein